MADARVTDIRRLIDGLRRDRRQHPYSGRREYSQRARTVALMYMDDSSGIVGDDLRTLMALYARACRAAPPDVGRLAAWLVTTRLDGPGWPDFELAEFAGALGDAGLAEVARLTEERRAAADPDSWTDARQRARRRSHHRLP